MVGTAKRDIVPQKSALGAPKCRGFTGLRTALGNFFRPGIAADRFTPAPSLKKQAPPTTMTIDAHSGDNVIADIVNGVVVRSYCTPMLDSNISFTDIAGSATYYYNQDERQSVRNLTDSSAAVAQSYDYTAFGDKVDLLTSGSVTQRYTYTGRELNEASGDYYFRYRMYGAGVGGFLSRDPLGYEVPMSRVYRNGIEEVPVVENVETDMLLGLSLYSSYFARSLLLDSFGREIIVYDEVGGSFYDRHRWIEIHRDGKLIAAFGNYPGKGGAFSGDPGDLQIPDGHAFDPKKTLNKRYDSTPFQEAALIFLILTQLNNPPRYQFPNKQCRTFVGDMITILEDMLGKKLKEQQGDDPSVIRPGDTNNTKKKMKSQMEDFILEHLPGKTLIDPREGNDTEYKYDKEKLKKIFDNIK